MKSALKLSIILWMVVLLISFGGLVYLSPSYILVGAFSQVLRTPENPELLHWFYGCAASFLIGICVTARLWRIYRQQYGNLWKSD
jgi:hypothetical protein